MTEQNPRLDGRTKRALDAAIARKQVSQESYRAVLAGVLSLQEAKAIGRDGSPATDATEGSGGPGAATETSVRPTDTPGRCCLCGCGQVPRGKKSRFVQGHDSRLHGELKRTLEKDPLLRNERFTEEQRSYAVERRLMAE